MGSKSKDKSLFSELMFLKQSSLAHFAHRKCNTFIRMPVLLWLSAGCRGLGRGIRMNPTP